MLAGAKASDADLVLGDFNATSDHAPMRAWKDAGWRDSLELVNAGLEPHLAGQRHLAGPGTSTRRR